MRSLPLSFFSLFHQVRQRKRLVKLIQSKIVSGVLMRPFTAEQMSDNIHKLCGFQKKDVPWYMQTGFK